MSSHAYVADGNITPSRFVKNSSTQSRVVQAGAGNVCVGVSQPGKRRPPGTAADDGYAAVQDEMIQVYQFGETDVPLTAGDTIALGDRLKSDSSGRGVPAAAGDAAYAVALEATSVTGAIIKVLLIYDTAPAA